MDYQVIFKDTFRADLEHIILVPEAVADVADAFAWYEEQAPGLGDKFLSCPDEAYEAIAVAPSVFRCASTPSASSSCGAFPMRSTSKTLPPRRRIGFNADNP